jgi:hypothetical protein
VGSGGQQNITKLSKLGPRAIQYTRTANGKGSYALLLLLDAGLQCVEFLQGDEGNTKSSSEEYDSISSIVKRRRHPTALGFWHRPQLYINCTYCTCIFVRTRHVCMKKVVSGAIPCPPPILK